MSGEKPKAMITVGDASETVNKTSRRSPCHSILTRLAAITFCILPLWVVAQPVVPGFDRFPHDTPAAQIAGGEALIARAGEHAPIIEADILSKLDPAPEVVVVKPCGFPLTKTLQEQGALRELLSDLDWPAVKNNQIYLADGNAYFNRPGPRLVESAELLACCIHPEVFGDPAQRFPGEAVRLELNAK